MRVEERRKKGVGDIRAEPLIPPMDLTEGSRMEALVAISWRVGASEREKATEDLHFFIEDLGRF